MAIEIERKFLVKGDFKAEVICSRHIVQGYISSQPERTVRIRISDRDGFITIKGISDTAGLCRAEFEYPIPVVDAEELIRLCEPGIIDKVRYEVPVEGHLWEVDVFHGVNEGLVTAEIELASADEQVQLPGWLGQEVTGDRKYYNSMLSKRPYNQWSESEKQTN
ncbi:MAG: CYTH domain-containing protein [Tannerellaceae bacterium]|nr:CYTH domain-containing protein [Tannerellaceae bacterium]MCD8263746.1 CYTH domain-containing protein [Tannerellaceae bacterium]